MSLRKKFFGIITASMMFATSILCAVPASAANHTESGYYGFNVDLSNYYTPVWYNSVTSYDYQHSFWRWNWKLDRYSYNENIQRAHYVIKTKGNNYTTSIKITPKFERWDDTPGYWATGFGTYTSMTHILTLRSPY